MLRWAGALLLIGVMLPAAPPLVDRAAASAARSPASEVALTVSLPGRTGFQRNALAEVVVTLRNVSGHDIQWDYGQGNDLHPRFNSDCTRVLDWHAVGGFLFSPVTQVNDTVPFTLSSAPAPQTPSNTKTARAQYNAPFEALNTVPHFIARQTETRLAYPERGVPGGLVTESRTMEYVGPDRLSNTSRALNPVGTMVTQRYVQVGPVICSLEPYNFPAHTWQPYPYDAFSYRNHRPDIGLTGMQSLRLTYSVPKRSGISDGPPQPVTTVRFSRRQGTVSVQGQPVSVWIIQIHVRSLYATTFIRIRYKGRLYRPSESNETARLIINAASFLPMQFQSTTQYTIGKGIHVLADRRQISFDYDSTPTIQVPSSTCG